MYKLKVGLVGVMQVNFIGDKQREFNKAVNELKTLSKEISFDFYFYPELVVTREEAEKARKTLEAQGIEFLLVQNSSFAAGEAIIPFAKMNSYLGLWAISEPNTSGVLSLNSLCGINMYGSIITNYLKEYAIKYKWFFGNIDNPLFIDRFKVTIKALTAVQKMKKAKVALVGGIAPGFNDLYFDERLGEKRLGVNIQRNHEFSEIKKRALSYKASELEETKKLVTCGYCSISDEAKKDIEQYARIYKAYKDFADDYNYEALAISCWPKMQDELNMLTCSTLGALNQNGIPAACEGDLPGAVSMLMLKYLTEQEATLMDLVAFDEKDETIQLWHCGPSPVCYANENGACLETLPLNMPDGSIKNMSSINNLVFKVQKASVMRFTGEWDKIFIADGKFLNSNKPSYIGSRGWLGELRLNGEVITARNLINTILVQGFQHHYAVIPGDVTEELMEMAAWLDLDTLNAIQYKNYLQKQKF